MLQFITATPAAFAELCKQMKEACIVFERQPMPVGAKPTVARIGFEQDPSDSAILLLVENGLQYSGGNQQIAQWLNSGEKRFSTPDELLQWLKGELASGYPQFTKTAPDVVKQDNSDSDVLEQIIQSTDQTVLVTELITELALKHSLLIQRIDLALAVDIANQARKVGGAISDFQTIVHKAFNNQFATTAQGHTLSSNQIAYSLNQNGTLSEIKQGSNKRRNKWNTSL